MTDPNRGPARERTYAELKHDTQNSYEELIAARAQLKDAEEAYTDDVRECVDRGITVNVHG